LAVDARHAAGDDRPTGVQLGFGSAGLTSLTYRGVELLASGELRVNEVRLRRWDGTTETGELKDVRVAVDPARRQVTRTYPWGCVACEYVPEGSRLGLRLTVTNSSDRIIQGLFLEPLQLRFPAPPRGWDGNPRLAHNIGVPTELLADYGSGVLAVCNEDVGRPLMCGFPWPLDRPVSKTYPLWLYTSRHASLPDSLPYVERPVYPGGVDQYTLSLRFGAPGASEAELTADLDLKFAAAYPFRLAWKDRRPIGQLVLSSAERTSAANPRGWFQDPKLDVTTPPGRAEFKQRLTRYAEESVRVLKQNGAQGMILWDPEGQEFPHATSYLGDPRSLPAEIEPELDAFFQRFREAGLRTGLCIRPQLPVRKAYTEGVSQVEVADPARNLLDKIATAKRRWGCTLFYVDSNGDPNFPIDAAIFQQVAASQPEVLLIPEHQNTRYYAYTAPYDELRGGVASTPETVRRVYPGAFTVIAVPDGPIDARRAELVDAVRRGDVLLFRAWFDDSYNEKVRAIYADARR
jgi:hypothetical protein